MAFERFNLEGRVALITGAAGLLGVEHASALLESGAHVIITDINWNHLNIASETLKKVYDPKKIKTCLMDVTSIDSISSFHHALVQEGISVNILINNAAVDPKVVEKNCSLENSRLENFSLEQWNYQIQVGLTGAFICSQIFGSAMAKDGAGGVILNIASDLSIISPDQRLYLKDGLPEDDQPVKPVTYSVIKAGMVGLTRYLSTYWAQKGVRCNAISPGGVLNGQSDEFVSRISQLIPLGRMAHKEEYRAAIQFLCSDASSYMNGQNLVIDGGRSVL